MTAAISVVIPTRDRATLLRASLASLVAQTLERSRVEVVVVDDGSTDDTAAVCKGMESQLELRYHRIAPSGISAAKNLGIFVASAPIVLFFDDDDVADPDLLRQHLREHEDHPDPALAVLGHTTWSPDLRVTELMHYVTEVGKFLFDYTSITHGQLLDHTWFWGGRSSCKRILLAQEGIFDPAFRFGSEDIELGYRLRPHGFKVLYNANARSYMNRSITFDEFCRRCERQGVSQHHFGVELHGEDPEVRRYCDVEDHERRWDLVRPHLPGWIDRVHQLEASTGDGPAQPAVRTELHELYGNVFRALRLKGIAGAAAEAEAEAGT
jgi:glycosyltransferase involved in cell wall biosynthesis